MMIGLLLFSLEFNKNKEQTFFSNERVFFFSLLNLILIGFTLLFALFLFEFFRLIIIEKKTFSSSCTNLNQINLEKKQQLAVRNAIIIDHQVLLMSLSTFSSSLLRNFTQQLR